MIEAKIICCEPVAISDLGLHLHRGQTIWINDLVARNSRDLRRAQAMGKVRVKRKDRGKKATKVSRPPPPFVLRSRPKPRVYEKPESIEKIVEVEKRVVEHTVIEHKVDSDEVARKVKAELLGDIKNTIAEEVGKVLAASQASQETSEASPAPAPAMGADEMASVLETVLKRVLPSQGGGAVLPSGSSGARNTPSADEPLYMPTNIVDKDAKAAITVESQTSKDGDDVDEAAQALRALRKKSRLKGTDGREE